MTLQEFINQYNGKFVDFDHYYGAQCVDLAQYWSQAIGGPRFSGNAADIYGQHPEFYSTVTDPRAGDIVIFKRNAGNGFAGHIAVMVAPGPNGFQSFDQNYPTNSPSHLQTHSYSEVLGYMRPKNLNLSDMGITQSQYDAAVAINQAAARKARRILVGQVYLYYLGRPPTDGEVNARQDQDPDFIVSDVKNSPEAKAYAGKTPDASVLQRFKDYINQFKG